MSFNILKKELIEGVVRGLYLFYGPEAYMAGHYAKEVERLIIEPFAKDVSYNLFDGKADLWAIYNACVASPFFGERRLVVVKDSGLFKPAPADGAQKRVGGQKRDSAKKREGPQKQVEMSLGYIIDHLPKSTCLLIMEPTADKRTSLYKHIAEKGLVVEFALQPQSKLESWAMTIAGRGGMKFTRDALRLFIDVAGDSMTEVRSELDKLLMYVSGKRGITAEDVAAVCHIPLRAKIFDLLDNIAAGRRKQAMIELDALLREREPAMRIMSVLSGHLVLLLQIKALADGGARLSEATKLMGLHSYRAEKLWRQGARVSAGDVALAIEQCHIQDVAVKSGQIGDIPALQLLVASIKL